MILSVLVLDNISIGVALLKLKLITYIFQLEYL